MVDGPRKKEILAWHKERGEQKKQEKSRAEERVKKIEETLYTTAFKLWKRDQHAEKLKETERINPNGGEEIRKQITEMNDELNILFRELKLSGVVEPLKEVRIIIAQKMEEKRLERLKREQSPEPEGSDIPHRPKIK